MFDPATAVSSETRRSAIGRFVRHGVPILFYTLAALLLTWPLVTQITTHVPGDGIDDPSLAWNLWWVGERLVQQGNADIFHAGWMFHPVTINLGFYTLTPLYGLLALPMGLTSGLTLANNLLLLSTFIIGGYGTWLLVVHVLGGHSRHHSSRDRRMVFVAALVAGFLYAFAAPKLFYVSLGQFNIAGSQWIPFCVLYVLRLCNARSAPSALNAGAMAGLFLVLQAWTELTYASFLLLFIAIAFVAWFVAAAQRKALQGFVAGFVVMGALFVIGVAPFLAAMLPDMRAEGDFFASGGGFADIFSADLAGFLLPTRLHPWLGTWAAGLPFPNDKGQQIFIGYVAVLLAAAGAVALWRRARGTAVFWGFSAVTFWLLSLGPHVRWMGRDLPIPGPFEMVSLLPFFNGNRYPSRYSVMLLLCVAVLASAGLLALLQWMARRYSARAAVGVGVLVTVLIAAEHLSIPLPLSDMRTPPIYERLAAEPADLALLELPTGWRNGARVLGFSDLLIMRQQWWQSEHGKRRLGGNTSRNPAHKFQYFTDHPLVGDLIALMNADRPHIAPVVEAELDAMIARHAPTAGLELADLGVGFVTLHVEKSTPALQRFVAEALPLEFVDEWQGIDPEGDPATIRLFRVRNEVEVDASAAQRRVDAAVPAAAGFLAEGWSVLSNGIFREAVRPAAHLLLPLPDRGGVLTIEATASPRRVLLNGRPHAASWDGEQVTLSFGAGEAGEPVDRVTLEWGGAGRTATTLAGVESPIGETGAVLPAGAALAVRSAGEEVGDFGEIWLNGANVAADVAQRGYILAAMQPAGALLDVETFDTLADEAESARMAAWVEQWPLGTIVAGAVADEASLRLSQQGVDALVSLGVATDLRDRFRWSHAFIGVVGAAAGSALEEAGLLRPASVWVGAPVAGERVYGAIRTIRWWGEGQVADSIFPAKPDGG